MDHGAGEALVVLRVGFRDSELPQHDLVMRPRKVEHPVGEVPVLVAVDQLLGALARGGCAGHYVYRHRLVGLQDDLLPDRDDRVQHRAFAAGQRFIRRERAWIRSVRPRPMNVARSVSKDSSPSSPPDTVIR